MEIGVNGFQKEYLWTDHSLSPLHFPQFQHSILVPWSRCCDLVAVPCLATPPPSLCSAVHQVLPSAWARKSCKQKHRKTGKLPVCSSCACSSVQHLTEWQEMLQSTLYTVKWCLKTETYGRNLTKGLWEWLVVSLKISNWAVSVLTRESNKWTVRVKTVFTQLRLLWSWSSCACWETHVCLCPAAFLFQR